MNKLFAILLLAFGGFLFYVGIKGMLIALGVIVLPPSPYAYSKSSQMAGAIPMLVLGLGLVIWASFKLRKKEE